MNIKRNNIYKNIFKENAWFISLLSFFFILFFIAQNINHRFWLHDYEVYYSAANSLIHGKKIYGIPYGLGSGFYKYSPFALLIFLPFSLLPFYAAKVIHFIILATLIITTIIMSEKMISKNLFGQTLIKKQNLKLFLILLPLLPNVYTELHLGNVNIILLFIFLIALKMLLSEKYLLSGFLVAIGILIKPHFLIFLPLLLLRKKFKCTFITILFLVIGIIIPSAFSGISGNIHMLKDWLTTMQIHNDSLISGQDTLYSWIYRSVVQFFFPGAVNHDKLFGLIVLLLVSLAFLSLMIIHFKNEKTALKNQGLIQSNFIFEYFILLALVPNITVTDSEHFLLSIPLIVFIINFLFEEKNKKGIKLFLIFILILYGMNIHELVGKTFSAWLTGNGILGLANLFIIATSIYIYSIFLQKKIPNENFQTK